jgi:hypothetical protein
MWNPSSFNSDYYPALAFAYSEHFSSAHGAYTLRCRFAVLHFYGLRVLHFPLRAALHAVSLHFLPP